MAEDTRFEALYRSNRGYALLTANGRDRQARGRALAAPYTWRAAAAARLEFYKIVAWLCQVKEVDGRSGHSFCPGAGSGLA